LIFEMMKVSVGWHKCELHGGKYCKIVCCILKMFFNYFVELWPLQLSHHTTLEHPWISL
jgi:hypothetical protein